MSDDRRWYERDRDWASERDRYDDDARRRNESRFGGSSRQGDYGAQRDYAPQRDAAQTYQQGGDARRWSGQYGAERDNGDNEYRGGARQGGWPNYGPTYGYGADVSGGRSEYGRDEGYRGSGDDQNRGVIDRARSEVSSWFGDRDTGRGGDRDRSAGGGQHRGRGPSGYRRSDERIREDVNDRLSDDSWIDASHIEVHVSNGEVTLTGAVHDRQDKRHAEDLAERISGVNHVQNNLRVKTASGGLQTSGRGEADTDMTGTPISSDNTGVHGSTTAQHSTFGNAASASGSTPGVTSGGVAQGSATSTATSHGASATAKETL